MLPFGISSAEFAVVTFLSALGGILLAVSARRFLGERYLAAFAVGVYLWFFTDTLGGANYLDAPTGFVYSGHLVSLVLLFSIGLVAFFAFDRKAYVIGESSAHGALAVGALAALALGLHGMAEGADFGMAAAQTPSTSLFDAFGGVAASASWVAHKMLEPTIAATAYVAVAGRESKKLRDTLLDALIIATVFVIPAVGGSVAGYFVSFDATYIFALGLGASVYAFARAGGSLYAGQGADGRYSPKLAIAMVLGFLLIYISALLHS